VNWVFNWLLNITINENSNVTGASGNLGQAVIRKFLAKDFFVTGTVVPNDSVVIVN